MTDSNSAFNEESFKPVMLIQSMRTYDLMLALLSSIDADKAKTVVEMHERGEYFCPAPAFVEYGGDSEATPDVQ